ncbi:MAG: hypothetical protein CMF42_05035 [Legionellales bacterium]|nr:hypothetical protein [Legionellales bacterium]
MYFLCALISLVILLLPMNKITPPPERVPINNLLDAIEHLTLLELHYHNECYDLKGASKNTNEILNLEQKIPLCHPLNIEMSHDHVFFST